MCRWTNSVLGLFLLVGLWGRTALHAQDTSLDPSKALTQYTYDVWRMKEGLPHNTVADILQEQSKKLVALK